MGLSSCAALQDPQTVDQPRPLTGPMGEAFPKDNDPKATPMPPGDELMLSQTEIAPRIPGLKIAPEPGEPGAEERQTRFSLTAQDVDIKAVMLALSKQIKQNIVLDPGITRRVTVDLKEVTLDEALDHLLKPHRLNWQRRDNFIHVTPMKMERRMFKLNYIISRRQGASNLQSTSGQGTAGSTSIGSSTGTTGNLNSGTAGGGTGLGSGQGSGRTFTNLFTSEETDLWREIFFGLRRLVTNVEKEDRPDVTGRSSGVGRTTTALTGIGGTGQNSESESGSAVQEPRDVVAAERGYFTINRQAGIIIVKDYPDVLLQIAEFLEEVEGSAQRQVFILAKILEVNLRDEFKLGIDWSRVSPLNVINDSDQAISQGLNDVFGLSKGTDSTTGNPATGLGWFVQGASGLFFGVSQIHMNIMIDALSQQGNVSVLSNPKIATLNNQRAVIKVGTEDIFFIPQITPATTTSASTTQYIPSSITIGIVLDVLPQINENGQVMMSINTSISEKAGERVSPDGTNAIPVLDVRESNNVVLAQSGQTIVIGGLMKNKKTNNDNQLPLMGEIPLLGKLFQHEEDINEKTELVIMLTPQVMVGQAIDQRLAMEENRLQRFVMPNQ